jgi:hypothetical protein
MCRLIFFFSLSSALVFTGLLLIVGSLSKTPSFEERVADASAPNGRTPSVAHPVLAKVAYELIMRRISPVGTYGFALKESTA